jgi:aminoglycoside phosphotransferase (APT) family kinase protein
MMRQPDADPKPLRAIALRLLPGSGPLLVERTSTGVSTPVYRLRRGRTTLYLRLAEDPEDYLAVDARVHELLRSRGVLVPAIVFFEAFNPDLGRGLMVTTEIPGRSLAEDHRGVDLAAVLRAAGRDLAVINEIEVAGFGWVRRDRPEVIRLEGVLPTLRAFAFEDLETHLTTLAAFFPPTELDLIGRTIARRNHLLAADRGALAHGDFDLTHIYHHHGVYSGIIDFGEMRGSERFYDLGHFALHDGERVPALLSPHLLAGYREIAPLPPDVAARIALWSLLIGVRALARSVGRAHPSYRTHLIEAIRGALAVLAA